MDNPRPNDFNEKPKAVESESHVWQAGDLAYRKMYLGVVAPSNVFRVEEVAGNDLSVVYSENGNFREGSMPSGLQRQRSADDCVFITQEEFDQIKVRFKNASKLS
jgi:hypothetical protein